MWALVPLGNSAGSRGAGAELPARAPCLPDGFIPAPYASSSAHRLVQQTAARPAPQAGCGPCRSGHRPRTALRGERSRRHWHEIGLAGAPGRCSHCSGATGERLQNCLLLGMRLRVPALQLPADSCPVLPAAHLPSWEPRPPATCLLLYSVLGLLDLGGAWHPLPGIASPCAGPPDPGCLAPAPWHCVSSRSLATACWHRFRVFVSHSPACLQPWPVPAAPDSPRSF